MKNKMFFGVLLISALTLCSCMNEELASHQDEQPIKGEFVGAQVAQTTNDEDETPPLSNEAGNDYVTDLPTIIEEADYFVDVPILGTYLEQTSSIVRQYFKNDVLYATVALSDGKMAQDFDVYNPLGNLNCLNVTKRCQDQYPNCPIIGYVYVTDGYSVIYPVVMNVSENKVQYYYNGLADFRMVDAFETIDDGRRAYVNYFAEQKRILSKIPIYPWKEADNNYNYSYLNKFLQDDIWKDEALVAKLPNTEFIMQYDFHVAIPLLDDKGNEGVFVGYLLYHKNKLIAEIVLKVNSSGYVAEFINVAEYNTQTKTFDFIETSNYEKAITLSENKVSASPSSLDGVMWENHKYCTD